MQAYSLKALMWMKEELFGIEEAFRLSDKIMKAYAEFHSRGKETSVELYLLNHWAKDLSLRDLVDRIASLGEDHFSCLFAWLMSTRGESPLPIEDFRKAAILMASDLEDEEVTRFFEGAVERQGRTKVKEFMEMQLMNSQRVYHRFITWFDQKFEDEKSKG